MKDKEEILVPEAKEQPEQKEEPEKIELTRIIRLILAISFIVLNITFSADVGVIASSKFSIQDDLDFNDKEFATFNSITSTGRILGTFIYMGLLTRDNRKTLNIVCLSLSILLFFSFTVIKNKFLLFGVRFLIGFSRNFFQIYVPVYVDQFGVKPLKTILISICNITSPLGRALGFGIGTFTGSERWVVSFSIIGFILLCIGVIMLLSPPKYYSARAGWVGYYVKDENGKDIKLVRKKEDDKVYSDSIFESGEIKSKKKGGIECSELVGILKNPTFMFSTFTRASTSFIFDISHLFIKDYVRKGLKFTDDKVLFYYYSLASIVGPSLGGAVGGLIITKVGGYEHHNSCKVIPIFALLTLGTTFLVNFTDKFYWFSLSLGIFYFTAYMFYPIITGYAVNALNPKQKGTGYSFTILVCTICGNLPGPLYYGFINDKFKATNPRLAWRCSFFYFFLGCTLLQFSCYYRYKDLIKKEEELKEKEKEEELKEVPETNK